MMSARATGRMLASIGAPGMSYGARMTYGQLATTASPIMTPFRPESPLVRSISSRPFGITPQPTGAATHTRGFRSGGDEQPSTSANLVLGQQIGTTRLQPVQVARSISEELQKDCRMEYTLNARSIVANLTRDHRRRLLRAILVSEYGQRIHPVTGEIPLNLFNKHDMDGDGVLSKREFDDAVTDVLGWAMVEETRQQQQANTPEAGSSLLFKVFVASFVPFMGFGFVDNFMMIVAGEFIEFKVGLMFGISTMGAAALGNLASDVVGLCVSGGIEAGAQKVGIEEPALSSAQRKLRSVKLWRWMGSFVGISMGCLVGMLPLLFITSEGEKKAHEHAHQIAVLERRLAGAAARLREAGVSTHELEALLGRPST